MRDAALVAFEAPSPLRSAGALQNWRNAVPFTESFAHGLGSFSIVLSSVFLVFFLRPVKPQSLESAVDYVEQPYQFAFSRKLLRADDGMGKTSPRQEVVRCR